MFPRLHLLLVFSIGILLLITGFPFRQENLLYCLLKNSKSWSFLSSCIEKMSYSVLTPTTNAVPSKAGKYVNGFENYHYFLYLNKRLTHFELHFGALFSYLADYLQPWFSLVIPDQSPYILQFSV